MMRCRTPCPNTLNIESLTENTTVEVTYEPLTLFDLPADGPDYTISDIGRVPDDYGSDRQIARAVT